MVRHDLHIHTKLSLCSNDPAATAANYLEKAADSSIKLIGFTNHVWDIARIPLPSASEFYEEQSFERAMTIRDTLPADTKGIRVLIGVETEFAQGVLGLTPESAAKLDYVLVPHSHIHMLDFVRPHTVVSHKDVADHMLETFNDMVTRGIATVAAHPFEPCGMEQPENITSIFSYLSDEEFEHSFGLAAENQVGIEVNLAMFRDQYRAPCYQDSYLRMFEIAKRMGCKFSVGSDSHSLVSFVERNSHFDEVVEMLGLTEEDMLDFILE